MRLSVKPWDGRATEMWSVPVIVNGRAVLVTDEAFGSTPTWFGQAVVHEASQTWCAVAQGGDVTELVTSDGLRHTLALAAFGAQPVAIESAPGGWHVVIMRGPDGRYGQHVWLDRGLNPFKSEVELLAANGTSQGLLDLVNGVPLLTDTLKFKTVNGHLLSLWMERDGWTIGQSNAGREGVLAIGQSGAYWVKKIGTQVPSRLAVEADGTPVVCIGGTREMVRFEQFEPWAPEPIVVPEFVKCDRPMAVGAWFDHDRPFLTHVPDGTGRWPQEGARIKGVFLDVKNMELAPQSQELADENGVITVGYLDRYGDLPEWGDYAFAYGYLTPGETVERCAEQFRALARKAKRLGRPWGGALSLHMGATDDPNVFKRDEQAMLSLAAINFATCVELGARFVYVFCWRQPDTGPIRDGILRLESTKEAYRRMRSAVPDPGDWPKRASVPVPQPTPAPKPGAYALRSFMPFPKRCGLVLVNPDRWLSSEPGIISVPGEFPRGPVDFRPVKDFPAPTAWQVGTLNELPDKHLSFTFEGSGRMLTIEPDGSFSTVEPKHFGAYQQLAGGKAPSNEEVAFRADLIGPVLKVVAA